MTIAIVVIVIVVLLVAVIGWAVATYNGLIRLRNLVQEAWRQIDVELTRRHDLIGNLVETVKGYAAHERGTLEDVVKARSAAMAPGQSPAQQAESENILSQALGRLLAIAEAYPDLKANENFIALQAELTSTEDRIASARRYYNATVRDLNTKVETVPSNIIAGVFNVERAEYFEAVGEQREAPRVDFGQRDAVIPPAERVCRRLRTPVTRRPHRPPPRRHPRSGTTPHPEPDVDAAAPSRTGPVRSVHRSVDPSVHRAGRPGARSRQGHAGPMDDAITIRGLTQELRRPRRRRRPRPRHPHRRGVRPPRARTAPARRRRSRSPRASAAATPVRCGCSAPTRTGRAEPGATGSASCCRSTGGLDLLTPREALASTAKAYSHPRAVDEVLAAVGPRGQGRHPHRRAERRPATAPRRGARHRRSPRAALPRRADHRLRPAGPPRLLGPHPLPRRRGHDDPAHDPLPRRGRAPRRPGRASSPQAACSPSTPPTRSAAAAPRRPRSPGRRTASGAACAPRRRPPRWPGSRPGCRVARSPASPSPGRRSRTPTSRSSPRTSHDATAPPTPTEVPA